MATKGTNSIAVPVVFTDNRAHCVYSSGGRLIFEKSVSTLATSKEFTVGSQAYGRVVFAAPNPDFAPKQLNISGEVAMLRYIGQFSKQSVKPFCSARSIASRKA